MTLTLERHQNTTVFQRCLIRITLRQQLPGLIMLAALWLAPFLTVLYWLRWTEYPLTQISPDAYGEGYYSSYWAAHWNHVGDFDSVLYGLVVLTSVACLLLIPATNLIRRDLMVRLNVVLWTQGASPPSGYWPRWPYSAPSSSSASAPPASSTGACCTGRRAVTCSSTTPTTPY